MTDDDPILTPFAEPAAPAMTHGDLARVADRRYVERLRRKLVGAEAEIRRLRAVAARAEVSSRLAWQRLMACEEHQKSREPS